MKGWDFSQGGWAIDFDDETATVCEMAMFAVQIEDHLNSLPATHKTDVHLYTLLVSLPCRCKGAAGNFWAAILEMVRERREVNRLAWD